MMKIATVLGVATMLVLPSWSIAQKSSKPDSETQTKSPANAQSSSEARYEGGWLTTRQKKLDGTMRCIVKPLSASRWQGRFWGEWQRVPFDYTVEFENDDPKMQKSDAAQTAVRGKAVIDGADYDWAGDLGDAEFTIVFTGSRYDGSVKLARVKDDLPAASQEGRRGEKSTDRDAWRFTKYNGSWWYWMPGNYWVKWDGSKWKRHEPKLQIEPDAETGRRATTRNY
jgi:hypothetical protein